MFILFRFVGLCVFVFFFVFLNFVADVFFFKCYGVKVTGHSPASSCPNENRAAPVQVKKDALIMFCTPVPKVQTLLAFWADVC